MFGKISLHLRLPSQLKQVKRKICFILEEAFCHLMKEWKKQTCKLLNQNFGIEPYLENLTDKTLRRCLCVFRISAHRLRIERCRYCGGKPEDRLCDYCNVIENEIHFLCQCTKYDTLWLKLFDSIRNTPVIWNAGAYGSADSGDIAGLKCRDLTSDESRQCRRCAGVLISR